MSTGNQGKHVELTLAISDILSLFKAFKHTHRPFDHKFFSEDI